MNPINLRTSRGRLRSAIAATALIAASGAATAEEVELTLQFECPFPIIQEQPITAFITANIPSEVVVGEPLPEIPITAVTTVPEIAKTGLSVASAVSLEGTAQSFANIATVARDIPVIVPMTIPFTEIPVTEPGSFDVVASGMQESVTFEDADVGEAVITVNDLTMHLIARQEDGSVAPLPVGEFDSDCTLVEGQDNVLQVMQVVPDEVVVDEPQDIEVAPEAVEFGQVQAGLTEEAVVTVSNVGDLPLGINGLSIDGPDASAFSQTSDCSVVAGGESCAVTVTYFPSGEGVQNATLNITSDDADEDVVPVPLSGQSVAVPEPDLAVEPEVNFGQVQIGETAVREVVVTSNGAAELLVDSVSLSNAEFTITDSCTGTVIPVGETCTIEVAFLSTLGAKSAELTIASNDPDSPAVVAISAEGTEPNNGELVAISLDVIGSTTIAASDSTLPLNGVIDTLVDLSNGMFTGDLMLEPTEATIQISQLFRKLKAEAQVEFEQVEETTGQIDFENESMTATSVVYVKVPKVTTELFGFKIPLGGGENCQTMDPVTIDIASAEGQPFTPFEGGDAFGTYDLPPLENCGVLTSVLNHFMSGPGNTINLNLAPAL